MSIFRPQATSSHRSADSLDRLLRVTSPREWVLLALLAAVAAGALGWSILGRLERAVDATCVAAAAGPRHDVRSNASGRVTEILAEPGDQIEVGDLLARTDDPDLDRRLLAARTRVDYLLSVPEGDPVALASARAELTVLEAQRESDIRVVSPHRGTLTSLGLIVGETIASGDKVAMVRGRGDGSVTLAGVLSSSDARRVESGMDARVVVTPVARTSQPAQAFAAVVADVADRAAAAPDWLTALSGGTVAGHGHLVTLAPLADAALAQLDDGDLCDVHIIVERRRPIRLLAASAPASAPAPAVVGNGVNGTP